VVVLLSEALIASRPFVEAFILNLYQHRRMIIHLVDERSFDAEFYEEFLRRTGEDTQFFKDFAEEFGTDNVLDICDQSELLSSMYFSGIVAQLLCDSHADLFVPEDVTVIFDLLTRYQSIIPGRPIDCEQFNVYHSLRLLSSIKTVSNIEAVIEKLCNNCLAKFDRKLELCGGCKKVRYCSRECQREDWRNHKSKCQKTSKNEND
jgi:hypothetical protein